MHPVVDATAQCPNVPIARQHSNDWRDTDYLYSVIARPHLKISKTKAFLRIPSKSYSFKRHDS
jgi:hypothetical protein